MSNHINGIPAPEFRHNTRCTAPDLTWIIGREGDRLWRCNTCKSFKVQPLDTKPPVTDPHAGSPYRCREHHEVRVDRHGRGCTRCVRERRPRRTPKADPINYTDLDPFQHWSHA